jgi:hypothetical protein
MQNKTFRLFVSSTFSDFNEERKLLQTIVFPEIKKYCRENNLNFQPIDLRWGVTEEASNDQKTLSLCLEEVQNSKYHPYPNFLIMAGDRYGWVPLPYAIEENEYETILQIIDNLSDKELLNTWYKLDENQIPASYILNERKKSDSSYDGVDYTNKDNWRKIENKLKTILQNSVKNSNLNVKQKRRYFTSATEAEVIEGIFNYLDITKFQNKLLQKNNKLKKIDYENVFAYIRNIKSIDNEDFREKFLDKDSSKVNDFKSEIKKSINESNILDVNVNFKNIFQDSKNGSLNYQYETILDNEKSIFVKKMTKYLKSSIDKYIEISKNISIEELEKYEQERFKKFKLKDFLVGSRKEALSAIDDYINNNSNQALVIYGKSGLGKSSLMAKAIDNSLLKYSNKKIIYRFVASTANLNSSAEVLISILKELGIDEEIKKVINPQTQKEEYENIGEFYYRVKKHLFSIEIEIILFIDAIDQINNEDKFLWLPNTLPKELKIIISVLNDSDYEENSKYFRILETKIKKENLYSLEHFENPKELINSLLSKYDRKITSKQMEYLLLKEDLNSPLYLSIAAQELRYWKSYDNSQNLATNQKEIIKEFTQNLTKLFHHEEEFVKRVFLYLYISQGLSESELLELISLDKEFILKIAPETYYNNDTKELPIVIWARLHTQIKEFLKLENKDGQETMNFFHREFFDSIKDSNNLKIIQEDFISLLHNIITKYKNKSFLSNRWGKLFIEVIKSYYLKYEFDDSNYNSSKIEEWKKIIIEEILHSNRNLYDLNKEKMIEPYLESLNYLANSLSYIGKIHDTIDLVTESLNIIKSLYIKNPNNWQALYLDRLRRLTNFYYHIDQIETVIKFYKEIIIIMKSLYNKHSNTWSESYIKDLENLAYAFELDENKKESIRYRLKALHIKKDLYNKNSQKWSKDYALSLNNLSDSLNSIGKINKAMKFKKEALKINILDNIE